MSLRKYVKADYDFVMEKRAEGLSFRQIGELMGVSWQIARWLTTQAHRLPERLPPHFKKASHTAECRMVHNTNEALFTHDKFYMY